MLKTGIIVQRYEKKIKRAKVRRGKSIKELLTDEQMRRIYWYIGYWLPIANKIIPARIRHISMALARRLPSRKSMAPHRKVTMTDERRIIDTMAIIDPSVARAW